MQQLDLVIHNPTGLHARPAKTFVKLAKKYKSNIKLHHGDKAVNGKSLIGVLKLGIKYKGEIRLVIDGEDEETAAVALSEAVAEGLGEEIHAPVATPAPKAEVKAVAPAPEPQSEDSNVLKGVTASAGIAIGKVWQYVSAEITLPTDYNGLEAETNAFKSAADQAAKQLKVLQAQTEAEVGEEEAAIFEAHLELLNDPDTVQATLDKIATGKNAAHAWAAVYEANAQSLAALDDAVLAERSADMRDVGERVLRCMTGQAAPQMPTEPFVLTTDDLSPSMAAALDKSLVLGICTAFGGPNAHAAILARAFGLPALVSVGEALLKLDDGTNVIVDAKAGTIQLNPTDAEMQQAKDEQSQIKAAYEHALSTAGEPATTTDGHRVEIAANVGDVESTREGYQLGAEGVGLLRTEFLFLQRDTAPTVAEQTEVYGDILAAMHEHAVIIRTLDVGGDKPLPYINVPHEDNPFLGERGIRLCLNRPELLRDQLTAIAHASRRGRARIMFPMVSDLNELLQARAMVEEVCKNVGVPMPEIGIMIEVPAAALMADVLAPHIDFFSIGTNDLTQYTMAVDRMHPALSKLSDGLHPAVLRLISHTVKAAHEAGKWVGVCGALGSDPQAVPILVGLGVDELSVSVPAVPSVKAQVRTLSFGGAKEVARAALQCATAADVRQLVS